MRGLWVIVSLAIIYFIFTSKETKQKVLLTLILIIYVPISIILNDNVRKASTHGNTKHGWYSKYNGTEKFIASAWFIGFPTGVVIIYLMIEKRKDEEEYQRNREIRDNELKEINTIHNNENKISIIENEDKQKINNPKCPRCGARMIKRLAKRGRNKGNYFLGCSRYPRCKGTRSLP